MSGLTHLCLLKPSCSLLLFTQIWEQLDTPTSFVYVCRRLYNFSKAPFVLARWFLTRYPPYLVIFEAMARSKIFSARLFQILHGGGAVLSRNLAQLFRALHKPDKVTGQGYTQWDSSINTEAAIAVLAKAKELVSLMWMTAEVIAQRAHCPSTCCSTALSVFASLTSIALPFEVSLLFTAA